MSRRQKIVAWVALAALVSASAAVLVLVPSSPDVEPNDGWKGAMIGGIFGGVIGPLMAARTG